MDDPSSDNPFRAPQEDYSVRSQRAAAAANSELEMTDWILAGLCSGIACILGVVWMIQGKPKGLKMVGVAFAFVIFWNLLRFAFVVLSKQL